MSEESLSMVEEATGIRIDEERNDKAKKRMSKKEKGPPARLRRHSQKK